jgi:hypothetical protein
MSVELLHNGIKVVVNGAGRFEASIGKTTFTAPTFDALKKKLDKARPFEPFAAIVPHYQRFKFVTIVAVKRLGRGWRAGQSVYVDGEGREYSVAYLDTPENRATLQVIATERAVWEAEEEAHTKRQAELRDKLVKYDAPQVDA